MIFDCTNLEDFVNQFDIVENALDQRNLDRWNGRNLRNRENLAEHTHLVVACAMKLLDKFMLHKGLRECIDVLEVLKVSMLHDSLELLRGDILSITKDAIDGLRKKVDDEETEFIATVLNAEPSQITLEIVKLADLMACYKFLERELHYGSHTFLLQVYKSTKNKYEVAYDNFCKRYNILRFKESDDVTARFAKGYLADAGTDIVLNDDVTFLPLSTTSVDLDVKITTETGTMSFLCARTSAAKKGLVVATCPIDPGYEGTINAIVHNVSSEIISYKKGESFCQIVTTPTLQSVDGYVRLKNYGVRGSGNFGSSGK